MLCYKINEASWIRDVAGSGILAKIKTLQKKPPDLQ
jgi:hypothetical protein